MIFKRLNRTSPEQVFGVFQAAEAGISAQDVVALDSSSSTDGVRIIQPAAGLPGNATVGLADAAIANGAYGLVQIFGYRSNARVEISGATLTFGASLGSKGGSDVLKSFASVSAAHLPSFVLLESVVSTAAATAEVSAKVFIRCM